ncbi:lipopolysaccharide biosynthesis protein [Clostridium chromiireducens]|uniref:lipopolysaccharide biosynthesis protein n=1 Tax=Clostridium chromiireducens TaxID=225345 RepID=UPI003AF9FB9B
MNRIYFIDKYNKMSAPMKASIWFVICSVIQKSIATITVPIFTRILTEEQYGLYTVYQSWYGILIIFATLNLYAGVFNNGMIKFENDRNCFQSSLIGLSSVLTSVLLMIYLLFHNLFNEFMGLTTPLVLAMFVDFFCSVGLSFWTTRNKFEYKYRSLIIVTILIAVLTSVLGIAGVLLTEYKAEARILSIVIVQVIFGGTLYILSVRSGKKIYVKKYWNFALAFNLPLIPHYLSMSVLNQADRIMISKMVGNDKAAIYSVAYSVAMLMTIITQSINNSYVPWTYKALREKRYNDLRKNSNMLLALVGGMSLFVMIFAPEVIAVFAGGNYMEAIFAIPPVAGSVYFMFLYPLFCNIEFYYEQNKFIMVASSVGAVLNIILNWIAIPLFGYIVAGYTTLICYIIFAVVHYTFMKKICKSKEIKEDLYDFKFITIFSCLYCGVIAFISFTYSNTILRYVIIAILVIVIIIMREKIRALFQAIKK